MEQHCGDSGAALAEDSGEALTVNRSDTLAKIGTIYSQFLATGSLETIDKAIALAEGAMDLPTHSGLGSLLTYMKKARLDITDAPSTTLTLADPNKQEQTSTHQHKDTPDTEPSKPPEDDHVERSEFDTPISQAETAVANTAIGDPNRPALLSRLSVYLESRYLRFGRLEDLRMAVAHLEEALAAAPNDYPGRSVMLNNLGNYLTYRYQRLRSMEDLAEAILRRREAVESTATDYIHLPVMRSNLTVSLNERYKRLGALDDLEDAITISEDALSTAPSAYEYRGNMLTILGGHLGDKYKRCGNIDDLERAIQCLKQAVEITPENHPHILFNNLGNYLAYKYQRLGTFSDLESAIKWSERALDTTPQSHPLRAARWHNLGYRLADRYERMGDLEDLEKAIKCSQKAIEETQPDDPSRVEWLSGLANRLWLRYHRLGACEDLESAIKLNTEAIELTPENDFNWAGRLSDLACYLTDRFERFGNPEDLDDSIERMILALKATPRDHCNLGGILANLSICIHDRYRHLGLFDDLQKCIELGELAVKETADDNPYQAIFLSNLACYLSDKYERLGASQDIEKAIESCRKAVQAVPKDSPDRVEILGSLSRQLSIRYYRGGSLDDLNESVQRAEEAYDASLKNHHLIAFTMYGLSNSLKDRYLKTADPQDLEKARRLDVEALKTLPTDHYLRSTVLKGLGDLLILGNLSTAEEYNYALDINLKAWSCRTLAPRLRVEAARSAAEIYQSLGDLKEACALYENAVKLLPQISPRRITRDDQQYNLIGFSSLSTIAASIALHLGSEPSHCLRLLELGRGITTGLSIDYRSSFPDLEKQYPDIHRRLSVLRNNIDSPGNYQGPTSHRLEVIIGANKVRWDPGRQRQTDIEMFEELVGSIQQLPGFAGFLEPPLVEDLMKMAGQGSIIIVNSSSLRSDAILVTHSAIKSLPLPRFQHDEIFKHSKKLARSFTKGKASTYPLRNKGLEELLVWLWDVAVGPIFEELGFLPKEGDDPINLPRIWWIGVGSLSMLPFHAAGDHSPGSTKNTLCRVISSYIPTIKALSYARDKKVRLPSRHFRPRILLVTMPETPKHPPLTAADEEVNTISQLVKDRATTTILDRPCATEVLEQLAHCDVVHFTCHGVSNNKNPLNSHLSLCNDRTLERSLQSVDKLTVEAVSSMSIKSAEIAFIPACSTARIDVHSLADESTHISTAFLLSGFSHVLATLWETLDRAPLQVSCNFYKFLFDSADGGSEQDTSDDDGHMKVNLAFHRAVKKLRDENRRQPLLWASFIHTGA